MVTRRSRLGVAFGGAGRSRPIAAGLPPAGLGEFRQAMELKNRDEPFTHGDCGESASGQLRTNFDASPDRRGPPTRPETGLVTLRHRRDKNMGLREFMLLHWDEISVACEGELKRNDDAGSLARCVAEYLEGLRGQVEQASSGTFPVATAASHELLGTGTAIARVRLAIEQLSRRSRAPVMFIGEFGTGKRHCAHALHAATYPDGEFFELDSASRLEELERRLFALRCCTSAESTGGLSIYVHELSMAAAPVQLRLSQLLPEQGLGFRIMASSSRALPQAAREGSLRSDLVFRFPTSIELVPLRERKSDIAVLARHFAGRLAAQCGATAVTFQQSAIDRMHEHSWPGNLTELSNLVERLWQDFGPAHIGQADVPELGDAPASVAFHLPRTGIDFSELERELLVQALAMADSNQTRAASLLGLSRDQLRYRLAKFDIIGPGVRSG